MLNKEIQYHYSDIKIVPATISQIASRSECNPYRDNGMLPIFTAPMSSIVDLNSLDTYNLNKITSILPRNIDIDLRIEHTLHNNWSAYSLSEFKRYFIDDNIFYRVKSSYRVLIDIANGHMSKLYNLVKKAKEYNPNLIIMVGNIANPSTIVEAEKAGVDFIRINIGSGEGCITSSNTAIHYPPASLLYECWKLKSIFNLKIKLIADGGIRNYSDIITALALGADYVMIGGLFSKCIDVGNSIFVRTGLREESFKYDPYLYKIKDGLVYGHDSEVPLDIYRKFYGMASREGQISINGCKTKTSEGICKEIKVNTFLDTWVNNFKDYLKSAMSYCGIRDIQNFNPYNVETIVISNNAKSSINK